jgi:hypothetical protein
MTPKRVGFLVYPWMQALDLVGPMDALSAVMVADGKGRHRPGYEVLGQDSGLDHGSIAPTSENRGGLHRGVRSGGVVVDADAIFLKDGRFYTSAGITAGIDLTLAPIEEDYGLSVALTVARELVVYNLQKDLSVERLAARTHLGARHFSRRFQRAFGTTPAAFVETLRMQEARRRLSGEHDTIERVAMIDYR